MSRALLSCLVFGAFSCAALPNDHKPQSLRVATSNLLFLEKVNNHRKNYVKEVLEIILADDSFKISTFIAPAGKAKRISEIGDADCFAFIPKKSNKLIYSEKPWVTHRIDLIANKESDVNLPGDLQPNEVIDELRRQNLTVGMIVGMNYEGLVQSQIEKLINSSVLMKFYGEGAFQRSINLLDKKRVDTILACDFWIPSHLKEVNLEMKNLETLYKFFDTEVEMHFACKKSYNHGLYVMNKINEKLDSLINDGTFDSIYFKLN